MSFGAQVFAGRTRQWRLFVPTAARLGPVPLVMVFHQAGGDPDTIVAETSLDALAEVDGFMTAAPLGLGAGAASTWNAGRCCGYARDAGVDDLGFIGDLLDHLVATEPVDQGQVYAAGASNGGMLAYSVACRMAERFQAVFSAAGSETVDDCRPSRPITVVEFHSLSDPLVPYLGGVAPEFSQPLTRFTPLPTVFAGWFSRNRCRTETARPFGPGEAVIVASGCADNTVTEVWLRLTGGGHEWPRTPEAPVDASLVLADAVASGALVRHPGVVSHDPLAPCDQGACSQAVISRRPALVSPR